jgi:sulfur carrier protein ThiS
MLVHVRLFSRFRERLPLHAHGQATLELPEGTTVAGLLDRLGITDPVKLITVNGSRETRLDRTLAEGDTALIFPPVVGG